MNFWLHSIIYMISTCAATEILYVLPDNVSNVNCPSQPCATLGQYLRILDNGSLPVLSDVEYHFLPGDHHVVNVVNVEKAFNFSLIGFGLSLAKLICWSQLYVGVQFSYNVTIKNLVFNQCNGVLFSSLDHIITAGLFLHECLHCRVENIYFLGYGFAGINLFLNSYIYNVTIDLTIVRPGAQMCSSKFLLIIEDTGYGWINDLLLINQVSISGYNDMCYEDHEVMLIQLYECHGIHIELYNSQFYYMNQMALRIEMEYTDTSLLIKNCIFMYIKSKVRVVNQVVNGRFSISGVTIKFENCTFNYNVMKTALGLQFMDDVNHDNYFHDFCVHLSNVTFENCDFIGNDGSSLIIHNIGPDCKINAIFNGIINFIKNKGPFIMYSTYMTVNMNGTITILKNNVTFNILELEQCEITITKTITFLSNICFSAIHLTSMAYIIVMEYANITFINTIYHLHLIFQQGPAENNYLGIFPYCMFQYMIMTSDKYNISELIKIYTISFIDNKPAGKVSNYSYGSQMNNIFDFLTHCRWLPTAVFKDYNPGYINQQIVRFEDHQWKHHKKICYCPHDGPYDCTVDLLGPVWPGQKLQVDLCMPQAKPDEDNVLYAETHATSLPNSTCKIAHQSELINTIMNHPKTFNFTIISKENICELFFVIQNYIRSAFYVQLLTCPVGFTLQNGKCDCDPFLPPDIDTCYIDLSAIKRPANTWITAHTLINNCTNYLISDCPMDYCLPYSTNVNLIHSDLQCQFNRTGILCSQCPHPLSMIFASSRCMKCTNVHVLITIIVVVAGIVLVLLLYVLNLTVTNGTINGIIFYANIVSINDSVFLVNDNVFKSLRVFISFTNLDLGIETCFYNGMDSYVKMWLQLFFPSYLIIIAVSIIIASRHSSRILRLTYSRSLPVLATLFLLSYTGVLRVVLTVLFSYSTITHHPSGDKQIVWSIDASVPLFGLKFTILFITCIVLFLILISFNIALLFTRYLSRFRIVNHFKPLIDAFQGSYRNKYYYWHAVHMMCRSMFFSFYAFQLKLRLILATILLVIFTGYYGYLRPNKNKIVNFQELSILVNLTIMYAVSIQENEKIFSIITNIMMTLALLQFGIIVLCHILVYTFHYNFTIKDIKEKLMMPFTRVKSNHRSFNVALLDIPERTYNYSEYQDGLVSDNFNFN